MADQYWWCLKHGRVETSPRCAATWVRGPFDTQEAARNHAERADARDEAWEQADEAWDAWPGQEGGD